MRHLSPSLFSASYFFHITTSSSCRPTFLPGRDNTPSPRLPMPPPKLRQRFNDSASSPNNNSIHTTPVSPTTSSSSTIVRAPAPGLRYGSVHTADPNPNAPEGFRRPRTNLTTAFCTLGALDGASHSHGVVSPNDASPFYLFYFSKALASATALQPWSPLSVPGHTLITSSYTNFAPVPPTPNHPRPPLLQGLTTSG